MFSLKPEPLPEADTEMMERLYFAFEKNVLWPQQRREDSLHPEKCTMFGCYHKAVPGVRTRLEEIYQWEDFARANYGSAIEDVRWN